MLLDRVLPANQDSYFQAIGFMVETGQPAPALVIWQQSLSPGKPIDVRRSFPLLELLIQSGRGEERAEYGEKRLVQRGFLMTSRPIIR